MELIETTTRARYPKWNVGDGDGLVIGTVALTRLGRQGREFYDARALDGCDLGAHPQLQDAFNAVVDDHEAGCLRSPRSPRERYRPLYDGPTPLRRG